LAPADLAVAVVIRTAVSDPDLYAQFHTEGRNVVTGVGHARLVGITAEAVQQVGRRGAVIEARSVEVFGPDGHLATYRHHYGAQTIYIDRRRLLGVFQTERVLAMAPVAATIFHAPQDPVVITAPGAVVRQSVVADSLDGALARIKRQGSLA